MSEVDEIMKLLEEAKRKAEAMGDDILAYHIGTALLVALENALGLPRPKDRR